MYRSKPLHIPARLACVRHAASVRPEPGSNSCVKSCIEPRSIASSSKLNYELTVFVLTVTRENHSLAFVFFILYRFQGSSRQPQVALALTAQLVYCTSARLSIPFSHFFTHFLILCDFSFQNSGNRYNGAPNHPSDASAFCYVLRVSLASLYWRSIASMCAFAAVCACCASSMSGARSPISATNWLTFRPSASCMSRSEPCGATR